MTTRARLRTYGDIGRLLVDARPLLGGDAPGADPAGGERLARALAAGGPTFVKLGQVLSTRADLVPAAWLGPLERLQDDLDPFPADEARAVVADELGARVEDVFGSFGDRPLGAASLGQVHPATLRDGRRVAVKVQRPGVEDRVRADMDTLGDLASFLDAHSDTGRRFGFADFFDQFRRSLADELDYRREAGNLAALGALLASYELLAVPGPLEALTTGRVLTTARVDGATLTALSPAVLVDVDGPALADAMVRAFLEQVFVAGFFHADPHPGNVMLTRDHRLAFVDLGMVGYLRPEVRQALTRLVVAVDDGDGESAADVMARLGRRLDDYDRDRLRRAVGEVVARSRIPQPGGSPAADTLTDVARACAESGLRPPPELGLLARALVSVDRVAHLLDPRFDATARLRTHLAELVRASASPTPGSLVGTLLEVRDFAEQLPRRANRLFDGLATGDFHVRVRAFDETEMLRSLQKLANRVALGVVVAALLVASAIFALAPARGGLDFQALADALFFVAVAAGLALVGSIVVSDRELHRRRRRRRH